MSAPVLVGPREVAPRVQEDKNSTPRRWWGRRVERSAEVSWMVPPVEVGRTLDARAEEGAGAATMEELVLGAVESLERETRPPLEGSGWRGGTRATPDDWVAGLDQSRVVFTG